MSENEQEPQQHTVSAQLLDLQGWGGALGAVLFIVAELVDPFPTTEAFEEMAALNPDLVEILSDAVAALAAFADKIRDLLPPQENEPDE